MIPKIIHYCWLSGEPIPSNLQKYIKSWKKNMPDYEIKCWNTDIFDINSVKLVKEAYNAKKWAFAADYIRIFALYHEGGIYLDSDVMVYKNLSPLIDADFISAIEYHSVDDYVGIQAAVLVSVPRHQYLKDILDFYETKSLDYILSNNLLAPTLLALIAEKYGFTYSNKEQRLLSSMHLYDTAYIGTYNDNQFSKNSYCIHFCAGSWTKNSLRKRIMRYVKSHHLLFMIYTYYKKLL